MLNKCLFMGRVDGDAEVSTYGLDERLRVRFRLWVKRPYSQGAAEQGDRVLLVAFEPLAQVAQHLRDGMMVLVESHYAPRPWDNASGRRWYHQFVVERLTVLLDVPEPTSCLAALRAVTRWRRSYGGLDGASKRRSPGKIARRDVLAIEPGLVQRPYEPGRQVSVPPLLGETNRVDVKP